MSPWRYLRNAYVNIHRSSIALRAQRDAFILHSYANPTVTIENKSYHARAQFFRRIRFASISAFSARLSSKDHRRGIRAGRAWGNQALDNCHAAETWKVFVMQRIISRVVSRQASGLFYHRDKLWPYARA